MQRNLRNEVTTAFIVFLLLLAVVMSALVLTTANGEIVITATPVGIISNVVDATDEVERSVSDTPTPLPTETAITENPTEVIPTSTSTSTRVPPTETPTKITPTAEPPPTHTPNPTRTRITTFGALRSQATEQLPTSTISPEHTPTATTTASATPTATITATTMPTATTTPTATMPVTETTLLIPTAETLQPCTPPDTWTTYTVGRGNTLFSIARAVGSTVGELKEVNCIADADNLRTGDILAVPRQPIGPVRTGVPAPSESTINSLQLRSEGCGTAASSIQFPAAGQRLSGLFTVQGTAALEDFQYYRLEVRPDFTNIYNFYSRSEQQVNKGPLGQINAELFDDGVFWIRLTVIDSTGNFIEPCAIPVIFD
jgi:LysM repeat protein